jgi:glutamyl-tRNA reductase
VAFVTHARDVPATERVRFSTRLQTDLGGAALRIETCHRVEGYVISPTESNSLGLALGLPSGGRVLVGEEAIRHAISVAVGNDSAVVGEDQILHQLRHSVDAARASGGLDTTLERLFAYALQAGRRARSWRSGPQPSLADLALTLVERQTGSLRGREVLVVGAGRMGRLAARAAVAIGATVSVANRSPEGARSLAQATGSRIEPFDLGPRAADFAAVVVALGGPWPIGVDAVAALSKATTVIVDLSVPTALPEATVAALGSRFVSADAIALAETEPGSQHVRSPTRSDTLVERMTADFLEWLNRGDGRATAAALMNHVDREREVELAALWRRLPDLGPEARDAIEGMTRHLARQLLREPLERLGRDPDGRSERAIREIFAL